MTDFELKTLANELLYIFVHVNADIPSDKNLSARTNQILAFEQYAQDMEFGKFCKYCPELCENDIPRLKEIIYDLTTKYLTENIKTLAIY